jgi:hypothetical protein
MNCVKFGDLIYEQPHAVRPMKLVNNLMKVVLLASVFTFQFGIMYRMPYTISMSGRTSDD